MGHERDSTILDEVTHQKFDTPSKVALIISHTITDNAMAAVAHLERVRDLTARARAARHLMLDAGRDRVTGLAERALEQDQLPPVATCTAAPGSAMARLIRIGDEMCASRGGWPTFSVAQPPPAVRSFLF
jgi:hypothetical protein